MSWVHCNRCYLEPSDPGSRFFISSCGHLACDACTHSSNPRCPSCNRENGRMMRIDSSLPQKYQYLFMDTKKLLKQKINEIEKIRGFQDKQMQSMLNGTIKLQSAVIKLKELSKESEQKIVALKRENEALVNAMRNRSVTTIPQTTSEPSIYREALSTKSRRLPPSTLRDWSPQESPMSTLRRELNSSTTTDPLKSSSILRAPSIISTKIDANNIPKPDLRASFNARDQRTRSKSPSNIGFMQGTITEGTVLSINNRLS